MGVLWGVDLDRPIGIRERTSPVAARVGRLGMAKRVRLRLAIQSVADLDSDVGKIRVGHEALPRTIDGNVPGIEGRDVTYGAGIDRQREHAVGPIDHR